MTRRNDEVTILLRLMSQGDSNAVREVFHLLYDELRRVAGRRMRDQPRHHTLQPTALIGLVYAKLVKQEGATYQDRVHFIRAAATAMRTLLVDHARRKATGKRGGEFHRVPMDAILSAYEDKSGDIIDLDAALERLGKLSPRTLDVVELKHFAGLTMPEIADHLSVPLRTIEKEWERAREWLAKELGA